ncbi:MAG: DsbA family protein [Oligoflexia bacterium]|nr:DsbA family protein [Oligoflexia bacterium]
MRILLVSLFILSTAMTVSCQKLGIGGSDENKTFAIVNGKEIKGKEVLDRIKDNLNELEKQAYDLKKRATEEAVQKMILEEEAKKQNSTIEKLMSQFDSLRDQSVEKAEIQAFLKARGVDEKKLSKKEKESVPQIIKMQRVFEARQRYMGELRAKANVQFKIPRPTEKPVEVGVGQGVPVGPQTAKVKIVEFSDFQCPFCSRGRMRLEEIVGKYKDKVAVYFRHFPLESIHPQAFKASEASLCAQDQGKFWAYHNFLFDNQSALEEKDLVKYAEALKMDKAKFQECLKSGSKAAIVKKDMEDGMKVGVNSTPTFYINGYAIKGAQPLEAFVDIIEEQLNK